MTTGLFGGVTTIKGAYGTPQGSFDENEVMSWSQGAHAAPNGIDASFQILREPPARSIEAAWRACLAGSDFPTHYASPEYFCEPMLPGRRPFAVLSLLGEHVTAVLTGVHYADRVQSGLANRPQIAFSRHVDRSQAMSNLIAGLLNEAGSAKLIDLFLWSDIARLADTRFRQKLYKRVVMLDLSLGPETLFRNFSETKRNNIRRAIKFGVSVDFARRHDDVSAYYAIYVDWARRRFLPITEEEALQKEFAAAGQNRRLLLARHNGEVIAAVVLRFVPRGVVEHAAGSSLRSALHLKPNDLLHWRAIEWAYAEGLTKYSLGGDSPFLRRFGGEIATTTRHRLDLSLFRRHTIGDWMADWMADRVEEVRPFIPQRVARLGYSARSHVKRFRYRGGRP